MDQTSRAQIRLVLEDSVIQAKKAAESRLTAIYAKYAAKGSLKSGGTIKAVVTGLEEIAAEFITRCVDRVAPIGKDVEAFAMIQEAVAGFLRFVAQKVDDAAQKASGRPGDERERNQATEAARTLYGRTKEDLRRQLEIHRFTFTVPQTASLIPEPLPELRRAAPEKNRGGKPLAAHWDEMWAAAAVMLYTGDLQPRTQADVERAMKDWFAANNIEVGDTAVRDRARKLWQQLKGTN